jgi:hypothetical protein
MQSIVSRYGLRTSGRFALVLLGVLAVSSTRAAAVETEVRDFSIDVDGNSCGQYLMTITRQDDGTLSMQAKASLAVKTWIGTYRYSITSTEHWKGGRLIQMASQCNDDGTKYDLFAQAEGQSLRVRVINKERLCTGEVWTTSYWMLADKRFHNQNVPLLDCDTGKEYIAQLQYVGVKQVMLGGQAQNCQQFRVTGGPTSPVDLYFDGDNRLVRQEFTEQGKRVVFHLRSVKRS